MQVKHLPWLDLTAYNPDFLPGQHCDEKLIRQHQALPIFQRGERLFLAVADTAHLAAVDDFQFHTQQHVTAVVVAAQPLADLIEQVLSASFAVLDSTAEQGLQALASASQATDVEDAPGAATDAPVVIYINKLLNDAIQRGASDIHIEPYQHYCRIRMRFDGLLREVAQPPQTLAGRLTARLKVLAELDIAERRLPQDGRLSLRVGENQLVDFRLSTLPTLWGEKVVLRLLDAGQASLSIAELGFAAQQQRLYQQALAAPQGMLLVTGPTGSGKTVTLYTGLQQLNQPDRNIATAEDPIEINLPGINQLAVNPKIGLQFTTALRAFLRQDPDVIMVGEIRDTETAEIAIKAAQTGHLVLSTLHTNSACETLVRLLNMGIPAYNIAASVSLIIAQRLARLLCPYCKMPEDLPPGELKRQGFATHLLATVKLYRAVGCDQCCDGYRGRTGVYEVLPVSAVMQELILAQRSVAQLVTQARSEGVASLRQSALAKVCSGDISLAEANRITTVEQHAEHGA